jgi:hypothetical protein
MMQLDPKGSAHRRDWPGQHNTPPNRVALDNGQAMLPGKRFNPLQ